MNAPKTDPLKVVTGEVRVSYLNAFKPRHNELNGKEEYSATLLIPKGDAATMSALQRAAEAAKAAKWGGKPPTGLQAPWHDGDGPKPNGGDYGEECRGHWVMNVKSTQAPGVVDTQLQAVIDPREFVSGDYARAAIRAYAYDNKRRGVAFGLNNLQVLRKGEPLSGSASRPEDDFGGW